MLVSGLVRTRALRQASRAILLSSRRHCNHQKHRQQVQLSTAPTSSVVGSDYRRGGSLRPPNHAVSRSISQGQIINVPPITSALSGLFSVSMPFSTWIPPSDSGRRPGRGGAHFPVGAGDAPEQHNHPHKTVVKIGDNEWQASIVIDGDFHELGVFSSKQAAAAEVRDWMAVLNDDPQVDPAWKASVYGHDDDDDASGGASEGGPAWIRPHVVSISDNPILQAHGQDHEGEEEVEGTPPGVAVGGATNSKAGVMLSLSEVVAGLEYENGEDISVLDISTHRGGGSFLGDYVVFATGKSKAHIRKMGDVFVKALQLRDLWDLEPLVEGRDGDDGWMIVDCGDIIVHFFEEHAREYYAVEDLWVKNGCEQVKDIEAHERLGVIAQRD